ncbi:peptidoglycan recognition family protein [Selenomonas sp. TAMA-11512]|uniref:N-acetylmuramoyl-L-alanine amidase n=1 Tax=Selenomonas sp. TAMA-11512 TaxID=3095337 RepID=UPI0030857CEB|nr:peptidoglycan recognition family protein [Selenomonas sp. TAMA-11512]
MHIKIFLFALLLPLFSLLTGASVRAAEAPVIIDKPVVWSDERARLAEEYAQRHYGRAMTEIVPQAVVVHWTAGNTWESAYHHFYRAAASDGTVNYAAHFIVDRDGTIFRILPETTMGRHIIGYNWCSVGIENVGGVGGAEDLTNAQLAANIALIRYLHDKYPTIRYVFGHYQQDQARESGLYIEYVAGYRSVKTDPGKIFMAGLRAALRGDDLLFYDD